MILCSAKILCYSIFITYIVQIRLLVGRNDNYNYSSSFIKILFATMNIITCIAIIIVGINTEEWETSSYHIVQKITISNEWTICVNFMQMVSVFTTTAYIWYLVGIREITEHSVLV